MTDENWYVSTDTLVTLTGLYDAVDASYVNNATVTGTLTDKDDANVADAIDLTLTYVTASDGNYRGTIPNAVTLVEDANYIFTITAVSGSIELVIKVKRTAAYQTE